MFRWFQQLDRILRGELTRPDSLQTGRFQFSIGGVSFVGLILALIYGTCMGAYSVFRMIDSLQYPDSYRQMLASSVKTPALFLLTLLITFPSLYVFNALVGSRLRFMAVMRLLIASLGVNLAVLSSLGPIVAFFSLSTNSYGFMVLLNVTVFAVAGMLGLVFLVQTLNRLQYVQVAAEASPQPAASSEILELTEVVEPATSATPAPSRYVPPRPPSAIDRVEGHVFGGHVKAVFAIWIVVFGLVGSQMGWILRPFIGSPNEEFQWFRQRESNFFQAVSNTLFDTMLDSGPRSTRPSHPNDERSPRE